MICSLAADDARSVTAKNDVAGMNFVLASNTIYVVEFALLTTANANTVGVQFALTFGGTITRWDWAYEYYNAAATLDTLSVINGTTSPANFNPTASQGNVVRTSRLIGRVSVGASGGTLQLQHGSETATLTTLLAGSYGVATPV